MSAAASAELRPQGLLLSSMPDADGAADIGNTPKQKLTTAGKSNSSRGRRERPCDACRKRKSKCVVTEAQKSCAACAVHGQACTYVEDPRPRKRRLDSEGNETDLPKRRSVCSIGGYINAQSTLI